MFYLFLFFIEVKLNYNVVLIIAVQKVTEFYIYIHILFHILFHYDLSQDTEYSFLCSTAGLLLFSRQVVSDSTATLWTVAHQAPLSMGFPRQEYWSGLPFPCPRDLLDSGIESASCALAGGFFTTEPLGKPHTVGSCCLF